MTQNPVAPAVHAPTGAVLTIIRSESFAVLVLATATFFITGGNPWLFALCFFVPDVSFIAYTLGPKTGALAYNTVHSYLLPALLGALGWLLAMPLLWQLALILAAHIGFDRTMGYGLKYASAFGATHLGRVGRNT